MAKDTKPIDDSDTLKPPVVTRTAAVGQPEPTTTGLPPESYMTAQEVHVAEGGEYAPPPETEAEAAARLKAVPPKPAPEDDEDDDGDETASAGKGKKGKK